MRAISAPEQILFRIEYFLEILDDDTYTCAADNSSSIGQHVRHILDFFDCFEKGLGANSVCYDKRKRDSEIENSCNFAKSKVLKIKQYLKDLSKQSDRELELLQISGVEGKELILKTSISRELMYLSDHSLHHLAICKLIAKDLGIDTKTLETRSFATETYENSQQTLK